MKLFLHSVAFALPLLLALSASASDFVEHEYTIKDVLEVHAGSGIKLEVSQGNVESLKLKTSKNTLKLIHVDQTDNKLRLSIDKKSNDISTGFDEEEIVFTLVINNLQLLDLSGGVEADIGNLALEKLTVKNSGGSESTFSSLNVKEIYVEASGGSDVKLGSIKSETVRLNVSGGSDIDVERDGATNSLRIDAGGGSDCDAKRLASVTAEIHAGGASDVDVRVSNILKVSAGGASKVNYYGKPQVTADVGGASDLTAHN